MKRSLIAFTTAALVAGSASSATLLTETFSYPDGSLVGNGGWTNHSGTVGDLLVSGGAADVQHGTPSEDANVTFTGHTTGVTTADFDIVVSDDTKISGGDYEYFAHFREDGTFNFSARLSIVEPNDSLSGDYTLGISTISSNEEAIFPVDFAFGDTVTVSLSYDHAAGLASVTVGGTTIDSTTVSAGALIDSFALRQSDSSNNELIRVDNLVVSHVPEPASLALLGLGGLLVARRRKA